MKNNTTTIILVLISIGLFYTFTNGQYKKVKELNILTNRYQDVLQSASDIIELRDRLLITYEALSEADIERINKILPDNNDTVRLAFDLDGMASRYGIAIKNIETTAGASGGRNTIVLPEYTDAYEKATVSFSFVSNYDNFMRLLADLEKNLRIMDISITSFQTNESSLYEYKVSLETYWLK